MRVDEAKLPCLFEDGVRVFARLVVVRRHRNDLCTGKMYGVEGEGKKVNII